jgi:hypothetical protein
MSFKRQKLEHDRQAAIERKTRQLTLEARSVRTLSIQHCDCSHYLRLGMTVCARSHPSSAPCYSSFTMAKGATTVVNLELFVCEPHCGFGAACSSLAAPARARALCCRFGQTSLLTAPKTACVLTVCRRLCAACLRTPRSRRRALASPRPRLEVTATRGHCRVFATSRLILSLARPQVRPSSTGLASAIPTTPLPPWRLAFSAAEVCQRRAHLRSSLHSRAHQESSALSVCRLGRALAEDANADH